jgi:hypothetical protein
MSFDVPVTCMVKVLFLYCVVLIVLPFKRTFLYLLITQILQLQWNIYPSFPKERGKNDKDREMMVA